MKMIDFDRLMFGPFVMAGLFCSLVCSNPCHAQSPDFSNQPRANRSQQVSPSNPTATRQRSNQKRPPAKKVNVPAPEVVTLDTKDGVKLTCTWFAPEGSGTKSKSAESSNGSANPISSAGKGVAPFILLHDWDRSREDLIYLGRFLQLSGHAVIVPDFRGHGESTEVAGSTKPIDRARFRKKDVATLLVDIETCKKFLMRKNDAGDLNIDLLNVAAVGKTAILAMQWAISDWSWAPVGSIKQGQDVKSLILIAPEQKLKGASAKKLLKHPLFVGGPADPLPMLIVYSKSHPESVEQSTEFYEGIKKGRSRYAEAWREMMAEKAEAEESSEPANESENANEGEEDKEEAKVIPPPPPIDPMKTFVSGPVPRQNKPGSELIASPKSQGVFKFIDTFVKQAVLSRQVAYPWQKRLDR